MRIWIIGHFDTRESAAASLRVRGTAQALRIAGHDVHIYDVRRGVPSGGENWSITVPDGQADLSGISIDEYAEGFLSSSSPGIRGLFLGDAITEQLCRSDARPDLIILYGTHLGYVRRLRRLCDEWRIPFVLDVVEWYAAEDLPGGRFGPYAFSNMLSMRWASLGADGFFVISERLADHYGRTGKPVVTVPPLFAEAAATESKWSAGDGRLHLVYAGSPGNKEAFGTLIGGLGIAAARGTAITLHVVGITEADLRAVPGGPGWLDRPDAAKTICYGRVANARAQEIVSRSDFSLLLRPLRRSNQFGFPSKLAESMMLGTPVIANLFSDLSRFLRDGENALLLPELSEEALAAAVMRAADETPEVRNLRRANAQTLARTQFSPQGHAQPMSEMLERLHR
ncbi:glycosyltransferase [Sphingopyxis macrogoltabida]|uniref:Glycosyltransferase subfamily 4-like N-terminal domain-containing protein n=1 Tax=Sphingopyxis macrogoltabida TaxID=33050 RepID=A0A0N9V307_SPHMC|nr:glycosyltransferase [Sphingopyxis macrogoltabida]ALH82286.1 hypothetical protein AN936_18600 [Sphingopyxis macrogoltabida]